MYSLHADASIKVPYKINKLKVIFLFDTNDDMWNFER